MIIYIHGFNSSGNSDTGTNLKKEFGDVIAINYDFANADRSHQQINSVVSKYVKEPDTIIVGTSLGGFWANYFSDKYGMKAVVLNPTFNPSQTLLKYIGKNKNYFTQEEYEFNKENAEAFKKYEVDANPSENKLVYVGSNDTVIDPNDTIKKMKGVLVIGDSGHRVSSDVIIGLVRKVQLNHSQAIIEENVEILYERFLNFLPADVDKKKQYADVVWDLLQRAYASIGGIHGNGFQSKEDMIKNIPFWKLCRRNGSIIAAELYKDKGGRKSVAACTDGTSEGKKALKMMKSEDFTQERTYAEVSGPMLAFLKKGNDIEKQAVPYDKINDFIDDHIKRPPADDPEVLRHPELKNFFYQRMIGGDLHTKIMVGTPGKKII